MLIFPCLITDFIQSLPNVEAWKSYVDSGVGELERGFPAFKATLLGATACLVFTTLGLLRPQIQKFHLNKHKATCLHPLQIPTHFQELAPIC
jgi:hypothetical protein